MKFIQDIITKIQSLNPSKKLGLRATRHLNKKQISDLFSKNIHQRRCAEGHWYEAFAYEMILSIASQSHFIGGIVRKGADVPIIQRKSKFRKNAFSYNSKGNILIIGDWRELAELDILITNWKSNLAFIEVVDSEQNLEEFSKEIDYKRKLLKKLTPQNKILFLFISSMDLSRNTNVLKLLENPENMYYFDNSFEKIRNSITKAEVQKYRGKVSVNDRLITVDDLRVRHDFDYGKMHDELRDLLMKFAKERKLIDNVKDHIDDNPIVKKVLFGVLTPDSKKYLLNRIQINIDNYVLSKVECEKYFSKAVIALSLPTLRPIIYLKVRKNFLRKRKEHNFLKLGPHSLDEFKYERNIPMYALYYQSLDRINSSIERNQFKNLIDYYLIEEVAVPKKKDKKPNLKMD